MPAIPRRSKLSYPRTKPLTEIRSLSVRPLTASRIAQAYPLAQLSLRNCAPEAWDAYARQHLAGDKTAESPSGVLIVDDDKGIISGLLVYQICEDGDRGRRYQAKTVIVTDPFACGRLDVASLLLEAEERGARENACCRAEVYLPTERGPGELTWWSDLLEGRGYSATERYFFKVFGQDRPI